jgi:hypothetical protein
VVVVESDSPTVQYNPNVTVSKTVTKYGHLVEERVAQVILTKELQMLTGWSPDKPGHKGAYGAELDIRVARVLHKKKLRVRSSFGSGFADAGHFRSGVLVRVQDSVILGERAYRSFTHQGGGIKALAVDLIWFEPGYDPPKLAKLDPTRVIAFEIKSSVDADALDDYIKQVQKEAYTKIFGKDQTRLAISRYGLRNGIMTSNPNWQKRILYFQMAGVSLTASQLLFTRDADASERARLDLESALKRFAVATDPAEQFLYAVEVEQNLRLYIKLSTAGQFEDEQVKLSGLQLLEIHRQIVEGD